MAEHLSKGLSGAFRQLGYWIGTGTVGYPVLEGVDWIPVAHVEPSPGKVSCTDAFLRSAESA